uniref:Transmembrane 9 superfamily member n=1 Tax=Musa acuminata subsp. malaccensis TaxID=214687 RepID=A0A804HP80_MUSAM
MAPFSISLRSSCFVLVALLILGPSYAFYLPGSYMHTYYSLPYCQPQDGIKKSAENLGELLMGDQIDNSPYQFHVNRTRDLYQVNMILDNLPVRRFTEQNGATFQWTGFPVGYTPSGSSEDYIINHLKFKVLVHEYEGSRIVGFEVVPCSVKRDPEAMSKLNVYSKVGPVDCPLELEKSQAIREQEKISFTYEVVFVKSDVRWPSRWDAYLKMEGARVHWFSIMNSLMVIFFLAGIVFVIFLRTVRRDLTRYEELDKESQAQMNEELSGWKLVVGDVFREPTNSKLLCVMVGDGVQITGMAVVTIVTIKGGSEGWRPVSWSIACFFPGIAFVILCILNFMLIWLGRFYYVFGFLLIVLLLLVTVCAEVSVILTYMHLCVEDWQWWWKAFFASGSVAIYVFLYSINYLVFQLRSLSGPVSAMLYLGYSLIMAVAIMLSTGTIGFLTSFYFVHYLFSSVKID